MGTARVPVAEGLGRWVLWLGRDGYLALGVLLVGSLRFSVRPTRAVGSVSVGRSVAVRRLELLDFRGGVPHSHGSEDLRGHRAWNHLRAHSLLVLLLAHHRRHEHHEGARIEGGEHPKPGGDKEARAARHGPRQGSHARNLLRHHPRDAALELVVVVVVVAREDADGNDAKGEAAGLLVVLRRHGVRGNARLLGVLPLRREAPAVAPVVVGVVLLLLVVVVARAHGVQGRVEE